MSTRHERLNLEEISRRPGFALEDLDLAAIDVYVARVGGVSRILPGGADRNSAVKENDLACKGAIASAVVPTAPIAVIKATT